MAHQARDRFQNLQDVYPVPPKTSPGDPFFAAVTDVVLACGYDHAFPEDPSMGARSAIKPGCSSLATDRRGTDMLAPLPETGAVSLNPHITVYFDGDKGRYTVIWKAYVMGKATLDIMLYNGHVGPVPESPPGTTGSPFTIAVVAGPTWPANCIVFGDVLNGFVAGEPGPQGRGLTYLLQLRDRFGNNRTEAESVYLQGGTENYPWPQFRLNLFCLPYIAALNDGRCGGILVRDTDNGAGEDGIRRFIYEVPIREGGSVVYSPVDSTVDIARSMAYIGNGLFETTFTTDLAGQLDMQVLTLFFGSSAVPHRRDWVFSILMGLSAFLQVRFQVVDILGLFVPDRIDAIMGSDGQQGTAQFSPYMAPFPIIVSAAPERWPAAPLAHLTGSYQSVVFLSPRPSPGAARRVRG